MLEKQENKIKQELVGLNAYSIVTSKMRRVNVQEKKKKSFFFDRMVNRNHTGWQPDFVFRFSGSDFKAALSLSPNAGVREFNNLKNSGLKERGKNHFQ